MDGGRPARSKIPNMGTRSGSIKKFKAASTATHTKAAQPRQNIIVKPRRMRFAVSGVILQNFTRALSAPEGA